MIWDIGNLNKGKPLSSKVKEKISLTKKQQFKGGLLKLPDNKGKTPWNDGTPRTKKEKEAISKALRLQFEKEGRKPWNLKRKWTPEEKEKFKKGAKAMWERRRKAQE